MTQEEKQLLLKDLCGRLPYGVIVEIREKENQIGATVLKYTLKGELLDVASKNNYLIRPYLRPMSSMTEEEKEDFGVPFTSEGLVTLADTVECMDWLNAHHFDYRGLIEKGLALEAPDGMYKTE